VCFLVFSYPLQIRYATTFRNLFILIEKQNEEIEFLKAENQKLRDEINLLDWNMHCKNSSKEIICPLAGVCIISAFVIVYKKKSIHKK